MIIDKIENLSMYLFENEFLNLAIKHLTSEPIDSEYSGEGFRKSLIEFTTGAVNDKRFEAHRNYIDIHVVLEGREYVECVNSNDLVNQSEYDQNNDILFGDANTFSKFSGYLEKGFAFICFPHDAHLVGAHLDQEEKVKKVVYKVPLPENCL